MTTPPAITVIARASDELLPVPAGFCAHLWRGVWGGGGNADASGDSESICWVKNYVLCYNVHRSSTPGTLFCVKRSVFNRPLPCRRRPRTGPS